ncbi:MAG: BlaI/MecI/CopY family transcriptional regulator [Flavobacterium sp.]
MEKLTKKEEQIMLVLWKLEKAFVKEIQLELTEEDLHYNTVSTIVRNLVDKKYVDFLVYGNTHQYFPIISKNKYQNTFISNVVEDFFDNSYKNMVNFFVKENKISEKELEEIINLIHKEK